MIDKSFADVQDRYAEWAQTRHLPRAAAAPEGQGADWRDTMISAQAEEIALLQEHKEVQTQRLAVAHDRNGVLVATLAALQHDYSIAAHDRSRLRAQLAQERKKAPRWYETPLAVVVNLWDGLNSLHRQVWAFAAFVLIAGFVGAMLRGL